VRGPERRLRRKGYLGKTIGKTALTLDGTREAIGGRDDAGVIGAAGGV
jgi:hypothetical protein